MLRARVATRHPKPQDKGHITLCIRHDVIYRERPQFSRFSGAAPPDPCARSFQTGAIATSATMLRPGLAIDRRAQLSSSLGMPVPLRPYVRVCGASKRIHPLARPVGCAGCAPSLMRGSGAGA